MLGMTTLPATRPGEPICHLGKLSGSASEIREMRRKVRSGDAFEDVMEGLASSVMVVEPNDNL